MKIWIKILVILLLTGCVSTRQYKSLESEMKSIADARKKINKEIRSLENANKKLEDSISKVIELAMLESTKIERRLAKKKIKVRINPDDLKSINVYNQDMSDETYNYFKNKYNFRDTNSAKKTDWLTLPERELIYWLNYARLNPQAFCMKYIFPEYVRDSNNVYIATLMDYMLTMKPVPALFPNKTLFESAKCHAQTMGKAGLIGHGRRDGCVSRFSGECCSYGLSDPLAIVIQLLIDEHVPSLGHRYICLGTYSEIGISIQPHKSYGVNCVLDFGSGGI